MTLSIIAGGGVAKTMLAVTISLHPAAAHHATDHVTVKAGDTLSSISKHEYGRAGDWPAVWWANRHKVSNPSMIRVGQRLRLPDKHQVKPWLAKAAVAAIPVPAPAPAPAPAAAAPSSSTAAPASAPVQSTSSYSGAPGSFQSCVISAESGGNPNAVNPSSGAGGLYQFLPSTWHALGYSGSPQDAPVSVQNEAFAKQYAQSGGSAWSAYDGC
ncbi:MAG TPA: transglycosylase family protein [Streptosporangiaceae bacterium]|jgi:LysM repeat protein|nr:transglycosylase family protein [Streptosporangiaceae bacterium]